MIDSKEVIAFFDRLAPDWDAEMIRSDEIIAAILDKAEVSAGKDVLEREDPLRRRGADRL